MSNPSIRIVPLAVALLSYAGMAAGQEAQRPGSRVEPFFFAGAASVMADLWEDNISAHGLALRGGIRLPYVDISLVGERWARIGDTRMSSGLVEFNYHPFRGPRVSPFVTVGVGRSWGGFAEPSARTDDWHDGSGSLGIGVQVATPRSTALRGEALLRADNGGYVGETRLAFGYAPRAPVRPSGLPEAGTDVLVYGMRTLRGPWRFVEPGYGVRFVQPLSEVVGASVAFAVFHWEIPWNAGNRSYLYDTRAFLAMPGVQLGFAGDDLLVLRTGPALILMGEGTDAGANVGAHVEASSIVRPFGIPLTVGGGWLWWPRGQSIASSGVDQQGLTFTAGLRF
ncbi:hypothetical protein BH23GEM7_BH23GEM7_30300 [soil metagenome]